MRPAPIVVTVDGAEVETDSVFHYTSATAGLLILESLRFRLGRFDNLNDLREARAAPPTITVRDSVSEDWPGLQLWAQLDPWLRTYVRVGCFTREFRTAARIDPTASSGWSHPALWAHYGDAHQGICLEFDRVGLTAAFSTGLADRGRLIHGNVTYDSDAFPFVEPLDYDHVLEYGLDAAAQNYLHAGRDYLLFTKHQDWANEYEYRLVLLGTVDEPAEFDISSCLLSVHYGDAFPRQLAAEARRVHDLHPQLSSRHLHYFNRHFWTMPAIPSPEQRPADIVPGTPVPARRAGTLAERSRALETEVRAAQQVRTVEQARLQPQLQQLASTMQALTIDLGCRTGRPFALHSPITAIPAALRARADGVEPTILLEVGWAATHTSGNPPHAEFSAAIAVQSHRDGTLHLWGRVELTHLTDAGRAVTTDVAFDHHLPSAAELDAAVLVDQLKDLARSHLPADLD